MCVAGVGGRKDHAASLHFWGASIGASSLLDTLKVACCRCVRNG